MDKQALKEFLEEFRLKILEDGGDYVVLSCEEGYARLKIKGAKNRDRSRDNLLAAIRFGVKQRFPDDEVLLEMEPWKVRETAGWKGRIKDLLGIRHS